MTDKEAMKMALDWIEAQPEPRMIGAWERIKALRTALAQPRREWVWLTDEEVDNLGSFGSRTEFVRAIEAKLKEKND
jgi:hypothetical protein